MNRAMRRAIDSIDRGEKLSPQQEAEAEVDAQIAEVVDKAVENAIDRALEPYGRETVRLDGVLAAVFDRAVSMVVFMGMDREDFLELAGRTYDDEVVRARARKANEEKVGKA